MQETKVFDDNDSVAWRREVRRTKRTWTVHLIFEQVMPKDARPGEKLLTAKEVEQEIRYRLSGLGTRYRSVRNISARDREFDRKHGGGE
jgi:hypothetical protein